jgi:phosphotransferase system HPr (HPr) family protein
VAQAVREARVTNKEGLHARPVMRFVDLASRFKSSIVVVNVSGRGEPVDGKSAMQMMLLEATQGSVIRIEATGEDAAVAVDALAALIESGCPASGWPPGSPPPSA